MKLQGSNNERNYVTKNKFLMFVSFSIVIIGTLTWAWAIPLNRPYRFLVEIPRSGVSDICNVFKCADNFEKFAYLGFSSRCMVPSTLIRQDLSQSFHCRKTNKEIQLNTRLAKKKAMLPNVPVIVGNKHDKDGLSIQSPGRRFIYMYPCATKQGSCLLRGRIKYRSGPMTINWENT